MDVLEREMSAAGHVVHHVQCDPNMASSDVVTNCMRNWRGKWQKT